MNGIQYWPARLQSLPAGPQCNHAPLCMQSRCPLSVQVLATAPAKKPCVMSADWTEDETHVLLEAWAPKFSKLQGASQSKKIKIWNDIYSLYRERFPES